MKKIYDVYGVGDVFVDIIIETTEEELKKLGIPKGVQEIINLEKRDKILNNLSDNSGNIRIGGYTLNIFKALSCLGLKSNFGTKLGMDEFGLITQKELMNTRINFDFKTGFGCTDSCMTFLLPDLSSTRHKHEGISKKLSYKDIDVIKLKQSKNLFLDANLLDSVSRMRVARFISRIAKESESNIIFELNNINNLTKNIELAKELILKSDVVISSFESAYLLFNESDKQKLMRKMGEEKTVRILKTRDEYLISHNNKEFSVSKVKPKSRYSNEFFTAGFIFGFNQGYGIEKSCIIGSYLSSKEKIDDEILDDLHRVF